MKNLLLLHGALGSASQFQAVEDVLSEYFTCHHLTFSGHGLKPFADSFGVEAFAREVQQYIAEKQLKDLAVFGYSMGGYVALFLEANHPGTFTHIMTLGTKFNWNMEVAEKEAARLNPELMEEKIPHYVEHLKSMHGDQWKSLVERSAQMMKYLGSLPLLTDAGLQSINIPVRVSVGDQDSMVSLDETMRVFRHLQLGSFLVMPETPHPLEKVNPDRLAYKIRSFMKR